MSIGAGARSADPGTAVGVLADATGKDAVAVGFTASATSQNSIAIGAGAKTLANDQIMLGSSGQTVVAPGQFTVNGATTLQGPTQINNRLAVTGNTTLRGPQITIGAANGSSVVTIPGLATSGEERFVTVNSNGTLGTSSYSIHPYSSALRAVDNPVGAVGAMAAALTAIPVITTDGKTVACGVSTGAFGSSWAGAVGCVGKVANSVWMNGALSFTPSISTEFGSTASVGGRLGVFFHF